MKLVEFFLPGKGVRLGLVRDDAVLDITAASESVTSALDLVQSGKTTAGVIARAEWLSRRGRKCPVSYRDLQRKPSRRAPHLVLPLDPPEIWAMPTESAEPRLHGPAKRPKLSFKGTGVRAVGPGAYASVRRDSTDTIARPALAGILGDNNSLVAFTIALDLFARDLAGGDCGSLAQAMIFRGNCALGPCLVTADELAGRSTMQVSWRVSREAAEVHASLQTVSAPHVRLHAAAGSLSFDDAVPIGSILLAPLNVGPSEPALRDGDCLAVEMEGIGRLAVSVNGPLVNQTGL